MINVAVRRQITTYDEGRSTALLLASPGALLAIAVGFVVLAVLSLLVRLINPGLRFLRGWSRAAPPDRTDA